MSYDQLFLWLFRIQDSERPGSQNQRFAAHGGVDPTTKLNILRLPVLGTERMPIGFYAEVTVTDMPIYLISPQIIITSSHSH